MHLKDFRLDEAIERMGNISNFSLPSMKSGEKIEQKAGMKSKWAES